MKKSKLSLFLTTVFIVVSVLGNQVFSQEKPSIPEIPKVTVKIGLGPWLDHSFIVVGVKKGWFDEVGINIEPKPFGRVVLMESLQTLLAGTVDVNRFFDSEAAGHLAQTREVKVFVIADLFQGFSLLAKPSKPSYKSVHDFMKEGLSFDEAIKQTMAQLKGKTFAAPIMGTAMLFHSLAFEKAGMSFDEANTIFLDDPKIVELALAGRADFAGPGGAPLIVTLMEHGWKQLINSRDFLEAAEPSIHSEVLTVVGSAGWAAKEGWIEENHETVLRLSSVLFRIMDFYNEFPDEALSLQLPYLNSIAGTDLTVEVAKQILYNFDPFFTFEQQARFFLDPNDPLYYAWRYGADIKQFQDKGIIPAEEKFTPSDSYWADDFYKEMLELRGKGASLIEDTIFVIEYLTEEQKDSEASKTARDLVRKAKYYFSARNYFDGVRFAAAAKEWAEYAQR